MNTVKIFALITIIIAIVGLVPFLPILALNQFGLGLAFSFDHWFGVFLIQVWLGLIVGSAVRSNK